MMEKYSKTGMLPVNNMSQSFGDFSEATDYASSMLQIQRAEEDFLELPVSIRKRFSQDPQKLLEFLNDPKNREEADKLGLIYHEPISQVNLDKESKTLLNELKANNEEPVVEAGSE